MSKPILCLDFDGVCHSYTSGWKGATCIPDKPVDGLEDFLLDAYKYFTIHIYSSRSHQLGGREAMIEWFVSECTIPTSYESFVDHLVFYSGELVILELYFPLEKPPAFLTVDDRALCFTGVWPNVEDMLTFKPWYK